MHDHIYSFDKVYKYEVVIEPIPDSKLYKGYVYYEYKSTPIIKTSEYSDPEELRDKLIKDIVEYLDKYGIIPIDK